MAYTSKPVPQNIMSVEFKLFDILTVKQFIISFILVAISGVIFYFLDGAWRVILPMMILGTGAVVLFVPFNGEPFQDFLGAFMEAIISPQRRIWNKKGIIVKSALKKARVFQFGNDPKADETNNFKYADQTNIIKVGSDKQILDQQEESFLKDPKAEAMQFVPPKARVDNFQNNSSTNSNQIAGGSGQGTNPNSRINLNQFPQKPALAQGANPSPPQSPVNVQIPAGVHLNNNAQAQGVSNQPTQSPKEDVDDIDIIIEDTGRLSAAEESTLQIKNYIFGNVEGENGNPVENAAVVLRQESRNLEVMTTNAGGDFQSKNEYPEGMYSIFVNKDGFDFNEVSIKHNPANPEPVIVRPKVSTIKDAQHEKTQSVISNEGVFAGNYDEKVFDLGSDYENSMVAENTESDFEKNAISQNLQPSFDNVQTQSNIIEPLIPNNNTQTVDQNTYHPNIEVNLSPANNQQNINPVVQDQVIMQNQNTGYSYNSQDFISFTNLSPVDTNSFVLNPAFITIPSTLNGIILDKNNQGVGGAIIFVYNQRNELIRTLASDPQGIFYSYSSFGSGKYIIKIQRDGLSFPSYEVELTGLSIEPKVIRAN